MISQKRADQLRASQRKIRTPTYYSWSAIKLRCLNPKHNRYYLYGGRGIKICERWLNSYEAFLEDMGERPPGKTLGRKDTNGDYCKENCQWETDSEQQRNTRRNVWIEHNGERKILKDWATELGVSRSTIRKRIQRGEPITGG